MDNTIQALQNLYVALGGDVDDVANITIIPDMINAIATHVASGGAAELPTVTTSNNGEVLTVVAGKWEAAALPTTNETT